MSEHKVRELRAIEERARFAAAAKRPVQGPVVRDGFTRQVQVGDGVLLSETEPMNVLWRITKMTPANEQKYPGAVWIDVMAQTRVLCAGNVPNPPMVLVVLAEEEQQQEPPPDAPAPGRTPSGIILSDPDGMSER